MSLNTTPATFVAGATLTATQLNLQVRDAVTGIQAAWMPYTPTWASTGTTPAIGNGTLSGRYLQIGKTVTYFITVTIGSTTTIGTGNYTFNLPALSIAANLVVQGAGCFFDASSGLALGGWTAVFNSAIRVSLQNSAGALVGAATPVVPATGDVISVTGTYETP